MSIVFTSFPPYPPFPPNLLIFPNSLANFCLLYYCYICVLITFNGLSREKPKFYTQQKVHAHIKRKYSLEFSRHHVWSPQTETICLPIVQYIKFSISIMQVNVMWWQQQKWTEQFYMQTKLMHLISVVLSARGTAFNTSYCMVSLT